MNRRSRDPLVRAKPPPVPELTRNASIQLNERLSLRRQAKALACAAPDIAPPPDQAWRSRRAMILRPAALFFGEPLMIADSDNHTVMMDMSPQPAWTEAWHLWTVFVPRRSITGRLVHGQVWRRRDGRHWIYKKFTEFHTDRDH